MTHATNREFSRIEILRIRLEAYAGAGLAFGAGVDDLQVTRAVAIGKTHAINIAITLNSDFKLLRQRVNNGYIYTMQTARELIVLVGKLAASMKRTQDHLDAGLTLFGMDIHWHAAAVVSYGD